MKATGSNPGMYIIRSPTAKDVSSSKSIKSIFRRPNPSSFRHRYLCVGPCIRPRNASTGIRTRAPGRPPPERGNRSYPGTPGSHWRPRSSRPLPTAPWRRWSPASQRHTAAHKVLLLLDPSAEFLTGIYFGKMYKLAKYEVSLDKYGHQSVSNV